MTDWSNFSGYETHDSIRISGVPDGTRIVVVSDMQVPLEDKSLLDAIFHGFVPWFKPKGDAEYHLFLNGDVLDAFSLSRYLDRVTPHFTVGDEIEMVKAYLKSWGKKFTHRHYVFGNHEARWDKYVYENAPAVAEFVPRLQDVLGLDDLGYDFVPYLKHYDFEGFVITHGDTTVKHAAAKMMEQYHTSGVSGHVNRPQSFTFASAATGEPVTWYCQGMTCRTDIGDVIKEWSRVMPWQQGFLIGEVKHGVLHVELVRVHHGSFRAAGKVFEIV